METVTQTIEDKFLQQIETLAFSASLLNKTEDQTFKMWWKRNGFDQMTKDILSDYSSSIKEQLSSLQEENKQIRETLMLLHKSCLYQIHPDDDRVTHVPHHIFKKVESALKN